MPDQAGIERDPFGWHAPLAAATSAVSAASAATATPNHYADSNARNASALSPGDPGPRPVGERHLVLICLGCRGDYDDYETHHDQEEPEPQGGHWGLLYSRNYNAPCPWPLAGG